jgi:hypothetical protein
MIQNIMAANKVKKYGCQKFNTIFTHKESKQTLAMPIWNSYPKTLAEDLRFCLVKQESNFLKTT